MRLFARLRDGTPVYCIQKPQVTVDRPGIYLVHCSNPIPKKKRIQIFLPIIHLFPNAFHYILQSPYPRLDDTKVAGNRTRDDEAESARAHATTITSAQFRVLVFGVGSLRICNEEVQTQCQPGHILWEDKRKLSSAYSWARQLLAALSGRSRVGWAEPGR